MNIYSFLHEEIFILLYDLIKGNINSVGYFITTLFSIIFVVFCTMPVHESAHAFVAHKLGDNTAKHLGRISLNPMRHINYMGTLMMLIFGFGWAEPVPVNQWNFKKPKRDMAIVAAAGPISNILMAVVFFILANIVDLIAGLSGLIVFSGGNEIYYYGVSDTTFNIFNYIIIFLQSAATINIFLAGFNLIPFPPLDGSRIFAAFLPDKWYYKLQMLENYAFIILAVLAATGVLSSVFGFIGNYLQILVDFITVLPFKIFGVYLPFHSANQFI